MSESDGEDPLLLVGHDQWVPVPWRTELEGERTQYVKKEEEETSLAMTWNAQEPYRDLLPSSPERGRTGMESGPQQPGGGSGLSFLTVHSSRGLAVQEADHEEDSFLSTYPEADSSFVGMEIEEDEDVSEFTVPLRLESPPPRRRRSSNVSQREDTPGTELPPPILPNRSDPNERTTDEPDTRAIFRQLLQSTPAKSKSLNPPVRSTTSGIHPTTPFGSRRAFSSSPYPSPRFTGRKLGSLSPEKGVGPSRGQHPKLQERDLVLSVPKGNPEEIDVDVEAAGLVQPDFFTPLASTLGNTSLREELDLEEDDGGPAPDDTRRRPLEIRDTYADEDTDEEELENSLRVERELTEGLSDEELDGINPSAISHSSNGDAPVSPLQRKFKLFAESPSSDDGLIPLVDMDEDEDSAKEARKSDGHLPRLASSAEITSNGSNQAGDGPSVAEAAWRSDGETSDDDDGAPIVEITSKEPLAAARAAAILKHVSFTPPTSFPIS